VNGTVVDERLAAWCRRHLESDPVERFFGADHLSQVHGLRLADGRRVVLKVRGRQERLLACHVVHRAVWEAGIPCPEPLVGPQPLADDEPESWVTAEMWADASEIRSGDDLPEVYALLLADIVAVTPPLESLPSLEPTVPWLWFDHPDSARIWPPPASDRWDPHRIEAQLPPHIAETARRARERLLAGGVRTNRGVVGHGDLSGLNTRWVGLQPLVHDWDSVVALPEPVLAGTTAVDHVSSDRTRLATLEQMERFLAAYSDARGVSWTATEVEIAYAAGAWLSAYNAVFEHLKDGPFPVNEQLARDFDERLRRAGA
jgi:hypothetical protein